MLLKMESSGIVFRTGQLKVFSDCVIHFVVHSLAHLAFHCSSYHEDTTDVESNKEDDHSKDLVPLCFVF